MNANEGMRMAQARRAHSIADATRGAFFKSRIGELNDQIGSSPECPINMTTPDLRIDIVVEAANTQSRKKRAAKCDREL